jgi:tripartite-type tricarboxylate transporter receptor subunit TctC
MRARVRIFAFAELLLAGVVLLLAAPFSISAQAQSYPNAAIHFVTGFPPGSGADVITRYFAEKLRPIAGRTILVENKVGASGAISIEYAAKSKPDVSSTPAARRRQACIS